MTDLLGRTTGMLKIKSLAGQLFRKYWVTELFYNKYFSYRPWWAGVSINFKSVLYRMNIKNLKVSIYPFKKKSLKWRTLQL